MKWITDWRTNMKKASNKIIAVAGLIPVAWIQLPEDMRTVLVEWKDGALTLVASLLALAAIIASNIPQKKLIEPMAEAYNELERTTN